MTYLLRVVLPDRPGSLGAVATAIGLAGGDIVGLDVVDHRPDGRAVDDILVTLLPGGLPDTLVSACDKVDGVEVEFIGHYTIGGYLHRDLEAVEAMTVEPERAEEILLDLIPDVFRSGWALIIGLDGGRVTIERASGGAPVQDVDESWLPITESRRVGARDGWAPESWQDVEAVAAPLGSPSRAIVFGRDGGPQILDSELARLTHLIALAGVIRGTPDVAVAQARRSDSSS
ncbi:MAG: hypothetical protein ACRDVZ_03655 [Jiangellaceae bacterium]